MVLVIELLFGVRIWSFIGLNLTSEKSKKDMKRISQ